MELHQPTNLPQMVRANVYIACYVGGYLTVRVIWIGLRELGLLHRPRRKRPVRRN